jgi:small-conductance mechanosensitive channel
MSIECSPALAPDVLTPTAAVTTVPPASSSFDERWEAWQAKGAAHDRAVRRKLAIAAPIVAIVVAAILYALVSL